MALAILWVHFNAEAQQLPNQQQCRELWQQKVQIKAEIEGWCLILDQNKGNCIACHAIATASSINNITGNFGPVLFDLSKRYDDRRDLQAVIFDPSIRFPNTAMPPYGKHRILNPSEIDLIVKYLLSI